MSEEVEKIMDLVSDLVLDKPSLIVQNTIKVSAAVEALVAERDLRIAECDQIAELNHTQWLALENVRTLAQRNRTEDWAQHMLRFCESAGSRAVILRQKAKPQVQQEPQERECECCNGTGVINERLGGEWNSNPAAKCPECDGAGVWEAKAQVQQEPAATVRYLCTGGGAFGIEAQLHGYLPDGTKLYAAPVNDKLREAAQAAFSDWNEGKVDLLDANMEALIEALEDQLDQSNQWDGWEMERTIHDLQESHERLREAAKKAAQWMDATCPGAGCEQPYYKVLADLKEALE